MTSSKKMTDFFKVLERVAATDSAVLIRGESGTGKELVARSIHQLSPRGPQPYNAINCAMLTAELATSELFGHTKGSFTGAITDHKGLFEVSNNGTLFLDEVAELPLSAQSRLLRVLQEQVIMKVGSTKAQKVNVRILSATHKALRIEASQGSFREDLMYRLRVVPLYLPRLCERGRDIEVLTWKFIDSFNKHSRRQVDSIADDVRNALLSYQWPGNIRELQNNIEYAFAVGSGTTITLDELTPELRDEEPKGSGGVQHQALTYFEQERHQIIAALNSAHGNKGKAANILGMSRSTLWRKIKTLHIPA